MPINHYIKKTVCTLLLAILVFNWCGYRLFISYLEKKANTALQARLDNDDYDHDQLISIKIPSPNLPYYNSSKEFNKIEGEIEMDGVFYKFVKRRLYHDTLEFLCVPNKEAMNLFAAKNNIFKQVNDLQQNDQQKKNQNHISNLKAPGSEYYFQNNLLGYRIYFSLTTTQFPKASCIITCFTAVPDKPPQAC